MSQPTPRNKVAAIIVLVIGLTHIPFTSYTDLIGVDHRLAGAYLLATFSFVLFIYGDFKDSQQPTKKTVSMAVLGSVFGLMGAAHLVFTPPQITYSLIVAGFILGGLLLVAHNLEYNISTRIEAFGN